MEFLPKEQCPKLLLLYIILLHDINYIILVTYGFHIVQLFPVMSNMFNKQDCKNSNTIKTLPIPNLTCKSVGKRSISLVFTFT